MLVAAKTNGATPLVMACRNGHYDVAEYLIEHCKANTEQPGSGRVLMIKYNMLYIVILQAKNHNFPTYTNIHCHCSVCVMLRNTTVGALSKYCIVRPTLRGTHRDCKPQQPIVNDQEMRWSLCTTSPSHATR